MRSAIQGKSAIQADALFEQVLANLPPTTAATLTPTQVEDLNSAFQKLKWKSHTVDWRVSIPFPGKGFYLVFLAGPERRSVTRLKAENRHYPGGVIAGVLTSALALGAIATLAFIPVFQNRLAASQISDAHATGIPWLQTQADCEHTGRSWEDGMCWDKEHDPDF